MIENSKEKEHIFTGKAEHYRNGRPGYAQELLNEIERRIGSTEKGENIRIADIGSGTGKFSGQLLKRGYEVYAIEPNEDMRSEAEKMFMGDGCFHSVKGSASNTGVKSGFIDAVTCAQSFHWFAEESFQRECKRILKKGGMVFLIWNMRDPNTSISKDLYDLFTTYCSNFQGFSSGLKEDDDRIIRFFANKYEKKRWKNPILFTEEQFMARNLSSSYALEQGEERYDEFVIDLRNIFTKYEQNGILHMPNDTVAYIGRLI